NRAKGGRCWEKLEDASLSRPNVLHAGRLRLVPGAGVVVVGCVVLIGWLVDDVTLKGLSPAFSQMKAITAFAFVLTGTSLLLLQAGRSRLLGQVLAALVTTIGLLTLCEYIFSVDLGIDQLLFHDS